MSFRSQAASKLRRLIFAKQYHSISSPTATAVIRRTNPAFLNPPVRLWFNRSLYTDTDTDSDYDVFEPDLPEHDFVAEEEDRKRREDRQRRREERIKAGLDTADIDAEEADEEDWLGVQPLIDKLDKEEEDQENPNSDRNQARKKKNAPRLDSNRYEECTDSEDDEDDEDAAEEKYEDEMEVKKEAYEELLENFDASDDFDEAYKLLHKARKFEKKFIHVRPEYRVIGFLMDRLKNTTDIKEKFLLQHKINRGLRLVELREKFNPKDPANYGLINEEQAAEVSGAKDQNEKKWFKDKREEENDDDDDKDESDAKKGKKSTNEGDESDEDDEDEVDAKKEKNSKKKDKVDESDEDDELEFDAEKEKDDIVLEKLAALDKKLEEKLAALDHTFGKRGKLLEAEIRDLAEERSSLTEKRRRPQYRIGFDVYPIYLNRTCKVTKGGQVNSYTAIVACGNYNGIVGFAKAKGPGGPMAYAKAYEKCFQNLHTIERHEEHTIAHAVQAEYKKTKVYLWPARTQTGMKAGKTVQAILHLAGFKNIKTKVVGSRNPHNTIKALFKALNAIETPKDVQEKFGRTVVESYLL